jgi:hypothetical protein
MAELKDKSKISYDTRKFTVHLPHTDATFIKDIHGLYIQATTTKTTV